jgi:hypothetical protein
MCTLLSAAGNQSLIALFIPGSVIIIGARGGVVMKGKIKQNTGKRRRSEVASTSKMTKDFGVDKYECFKKCVDDPWELKSESVCSSACGLD